MKKDQETTDKPKSKTEYTEVQDVLESLTSLEDLEENVSSKEKGKFQSKRVFGLILSCTI